MAMSISKPPVFFYIIFSAAEGNRKRPSPHRAKVLLDMVKHANKADGDDSMK
jgi:hypothetical protein